MHLAVAIQRFMLHKHLQEVGFVILEFLPLLIILLLLQLINIVLEHVLLFTSLQHPPTLILTAKILTSVPFGVNIYVLLPKQSHKLLFLLVSNAK